MSWVQHNLGVMLFEGRGGSQDYETAKKWFTEAADKNYAPSQVYLGYMYQNGLGVARDLQTAVNWYQQAAAQGNERAKQNLRALGVQP